jgi:hypothetical protein
MILNPAVYIQVFILILWFHSTIVDTLSKINLFARLFRYQEYINYKSKIDIFCTYPEFLYKEYNNWISKLLNCIICLNFWMSLATTFLFKLEWLNFFEVYVCSMMLYLITRKLL